VGEPTQYDAVIQSDLLGPQAGAHIVDALLVQESPHLQLYLPGTRIATAALLYSFGGSSQLERGVFENELLSACLCPGLDRNIVQTSLHDLNERLLYLHRRELRYRFETQPNLNKMIVDVYIPAGEEGKTMVNDSLSPPLAAPVPPPAKPVAPGQGGQRYRLCIRIKPGDFFEVTKALERLNDRSATIDTTVIVIATAKPGQPFNANTLHNLVVEPMVEESDAIVLEEQVEE
jgi:hypothetical protein